MNLDLVPKYDAKIIPMSGRDQAGRIEVRQFLHKIGSTETTAAGSAIEELSRCLPVINEEHKNAFQRLL